MPSKARWIACAVTALLASGCGVAVLQPVAPVPDAGPGQVNCERPCGESCCASTESCVDGQCRCTPQCDGRECGPDGCGSTCGSCSVGFTCEAAAGHCYRICETDAELCARAGYECGDLAATDSCGQRRDVACGECDGPRFCEFGVCARCETDDEFCARLGSDCSVVTDTDNCGSQRTVDCGACAEGLTCIANRCRHCQDDPQFCIEHQAECGTLQATDDCGQPRNVDCGSCLPGIVCNEPSHQCLGEPCETDAAFCARNGAACGWFEGVDYSCGQVRRVNCGDVCVDGMECIGNGCVRCETDAQLCARLNATCGALGAVDNCGRTRTVTSCGACVAPMTCGGGEPGAPNACGCTPETDTAMCQRFNAACGSLTAPDSCNATRTVASCGSCTAPSTCGDGVSTPANTCVCTPETDAQFCRRTGMCGAATALDNCGQQRTVTTCPGCATGLVCSSAHTCVAQPANDTCASPLPLVFNTTTGIATAPGDLSNASDDAQGNFGSPGGRDVVYAFALNSVQVVSITLTPSAATPFRPGFYLRSVCGDASSEISAAFAPAGQSCSAGGGISQSAYLLPGFYFLWIDGATATDAGAFTISAVSATPAPPTQSVCFAAQVLTFSAGPAHVTDSTSHGDLASEGSGTCGAMNGPEAVYSFTLASPMVVEASVSLAACTWGQAGLYLRNLCNSTQPAAEAACAVSSGPSANLRSPVLAPGTYYLFVDTIQRQVVDFDLTFEGGAVPANNTCAGATPVTVTTSTPATIPVDTRWATDDFSGSCAAMTGGDVVFFVNYPAGTALMATLTASTGSTMTPALHIRTSCATATSEVACAVPYGGSAIATANGRGLQGVYVVVDGLAGTRGPAQLQLTAIPLPCCGPPATPITLNAGIGTASGDTTSGYYNDYVGTCASAGPDILYSFTITAVATLSISVAPASGSTARHSAYLRDDPSGADLATAVAAGPGAQVSLTMSNAAVGTYYLIVDGATATDAGPFVVTVTAN